jgi:hypothetical protein
MIAEMNDRNLEQLAQSLTGDVWNFDIDTRIEPWKTVFGVGTIEWRWSVVVTVKHTVTHIPPHRAPRRRRFEGLAPTLAEAAATTRRILDMLPGGSREAQP